MSIIDKRQNKKPPKVDYIFSPVQKALTHKNYHSNELSTVPVKKTIAVVYF